MICDVCKKITNNCAILGIMGNDRKLDRPSARICMECQDTCPCNTEGKWWNGEITCQHGFIYRQDYCWIDDLCILEFWRAGRKWWSYLQTTEQKHQRIMNDLMGQVMRNNPSTWFD